MLHKRSDMKQRKKPIVGIIGGLGPQATYWLLEDFTGKFHHALLRNKEVEMPILDVIVLPGLEILERNMQFTQVSPFINNAFLQFKRNHTDVIISPCNTISAYIAETRPKSSIPFVNIIDETARAVATSRHKRIGLLATAYTVESSSYRGVLLKNGKECFTPDQSEYAMVSRIVKSVVKHGVSSENQKLFINLVKSFIRRQPVEAVILGCTDLCLFAPTILPTFSSLGILSEVTFRYILGLSRAPTFRERILGKLLIH